MGLGLLIAGAIVALGTLAILAVVYTIKWLKTRIKQKFQNQNVKKVAATTLEQLVQECPNVRTLEELLDDGCTDVIATVDLDGQIEDVEIIKNTGSVDPEVEELLGPKGMVVIQR